jgi:DNA polymerase delta subunit 1
LCYSTFFWLRDAAKLGLKPGDYWIPPLDWTGREPFAFVKPHIRMGILPIILKELLRTRGIAKSELKKAEEAGDLVLATIMDKRQLAVKITANSVYGFTSANMCPFTFIAESVTAIGRDMLKITKELIHNRYNVNMVDANRCLDAAIDPNDELNPNRLYYEFNSKVRHFFSSYVSKIIKTR